MPSNAMQEKLEKLRTLAASLEIGAKRLREELAGDQEPETIRETARSTARYCIELADQISKYYW